MIQEAGQVVYECGHCGNRAPMHPRATVEQSINYGEEPYTDRDHYRWQILVCPVCNRPILLEMFQSTFEQDTGGGWPMHRRILFPPDLTNLEGLPESVQKAYLAALKVRNIDPNAFAVLLGRTLEIICLDRSAHGDRLADKLNDLALRHEVPERLVQMAHILRILRNIGAHAESGDLEPYDVPVLTEFCEAILEYVYRAPRKLESVEARINALKGKMSEQA